MPKKRDVLAALTRDELSEAVDRFELTPDDRRVKENLVEALAASHKATLSAVLEPLSRDRLKELCRTLDLDDGGREKAVLIERLASATVLSAPTAAAVIHPVPASRSRVPDGTDEPELPVSGQLTRDQLQRYVWSAADILRGSIDSSDYKGFIFGLLFLKRLSDRFEEECEDLRAKKLNPEDPDEHQFFVPKRARWSELQRVATNVGEALNKACAALEDSNSRTLEGVLAGIDYNDERKLGDARNRDSVLLRLVQHFSKINLRNSNLSEPDMLGGAYEFLIEKFADDAGKKGGEFYTPRKVVELIVSLLAPTEGMRIHDPTCGSGGMLIECAKYIERKGGNPKNLSLFGQEKNLGTWAICKMNMLLHGLPDARIEKGDTIRDPKLVQDGALMVFDRVIANPPFSLKDWGQEVAENDAYGRFRFGIPPKTKGDLAFVQHMVAVLNRTGQLGVVMPHGVLFRGGAEGEIRKGLLKEDLVEGVIGLASNLFYGTGIPAAILVLNRNKKPEGKAKVLFINAAEDFLEGSAQNYLRDQDLERISENFHSYRDVDRYARVVDVAEIEKNDFNLNISRYVGRAQADEEVDVAVAVAKLREVEKTRAEAERRMNQQLRLLGYE